MAAHVNAVQAGGKLSRMVQKVPNFLRARVVGSFATKNRFEAPTTRGVVGKRSEFEASGKRGQVEIHG